MRLTLVSDAWRPQVNGVVRTLTTTVAHLEARGDVVQTITPDRFVSVPCPTYPEIRLALTTPRAVGRLIAGFQPGGGAYRDRGPARLAGARLVHQARGAVHDELPHALPRLCRGADRPVAGVPVAGAGPLPRARARYPRRDTAARGRTGRAWPDADAAVVARGRPRPVPPRRVPPSTRRTPASRGRCCCRSGGSRSRRTSPPSSPPTPPAPRSSSATVRRLRRCGRAFRVRCSSAVSRATRWRPPMPTPTSSYSPA